VEISGQENLGFISVSVWGISVWDDLAAIVVAVFVACVL
jgi:hypothetical protein